jgi:predicted GNAT superfamily acetyltransferase
MASAAETSEITIRNIDDAAEMRAVEDLQKEVWGIPDLDVVPLTQLVAAREAGGILIGAFAGPTLVGFVYGFPAFEHEKLAHHSHMLAVRPAYRKFDLGRRLKLAQREHAIAQGVRLMTWTFDPLQSLNAYLNFTKLGVVSNRYLPDFYGEDPSSFLHQTGTDRLWVSWFLKSDRVQRLAAGVMGAIDSGTCFPLVQVDAGYSPRRNILSAALAEDHASIEIPADINSLHQLKPETALRWREETRWAFTEVIRAGYVVDGFVRETRENQRLGKYLLTKGNVREFEQGTVA